ncbi:hypothetical protein QC762_101191 [Podospora pseudocomata]|uniref:Uncharacterized protein n=1 Tax=Podospora pseudocomata TaxID=2093779 RepID=A0ABR0GRR9_9PEZI|nr:hypothetical protein QC762_101191 [Podospora pseudocomata]
MPSNTTPLAVPWRFFLARTRLLGPKTTRIPLHPVPCGWTSGIVPATGDTSPSRLSPNFVPPMAPKGHRSTTT